MVGAVAVAAMTEVAKAVAVVTVEASKASGMMRAGAAASTAGCG